MVLIDHDAIKSQTDSTHLNWKQKIVLNNIWGIFLSPNKSVLWGCLNGFIWANPKRFHKTKCILLIARSKFSTCFLEAKICVWEVSRGGRLVKDFLLWERGDDTLPFILLTINRESYFSTTFAKICLQNIK